MQSAAMAKINCGKDEKQNEQATTALSVYWILPEFASRENQKNEKRTD